MFKIDSIQIDGFWHRIKAECAFNKNVNIIIGKNGTGKTTFMNILHSVLSVDMHAIAETDFKSAIIKLVDGKKKRTIRVIKHESDISPVQTIEFVVSNKKYYLRAFLSDDRVPAYFKKKAMEEAVELKNIFSKLITLSSLSVYRMRNTEEFEVKDRSGRKIISPVDFRLEQLKRGLTSYQLELSQDINKISNKLQKDVLASILYSDSRESKIVIPRDFDRRKERRKLFAAYKRLDSLDDSVRKKIVNHIEVIDVAMSKLNAKEDLKQTDFDAFQSYVRTQEIIEMSLEAESEIDKTYEPISNFLSTITEFIDNKHFEFEGNNRSVFWAMPLTRAFNVIHG